MNKTILIALIGAAVLLATVPHFFRSSVAEAPMSEILGSFQNFKQTYNKQYTAAEEKYRLEVFTQNYNFVKNFKDDSVTVGINKFSDLTLQEFSSIYMGRKPSDTMIGAEVTDLPEDNLPTSVDWRTKGAVTPIKNQGQCGSCWAFSTVGGSEGGNFLKTGNLVSLSEQQIVDCSHNGGNSGCNGGDLPPAYTYVQQKGLESEADYGYKAVDGSCKYSASKVVYTPKGFTQVPSNNPKQLQAAVTQQPVSVCIEADSNVFQSYTGGILSSSGCGTSLDHCVTVVGYDFSGSKPYWIVKNSWGTDWGNQGYIWIENKSGAGVCGINEEPDYPTN